MALSGSVLGAAIKSAMDALTPYGEAPHAGETFEQFRTRMFAAMGDAIVSHITTNAVVTVASVSGVTTGPGASGPGTGTIA